MHSHDPIIWNNDLVTGVEEIDHQHRILVKTLNDAGVQLTGNRDAALLEQITRDLLAYAIYHFETEEELMAQHNYTTACTRRTLPPTSSSTAVFQPKWWRYVKA
jgi:hemerythrin